MRWLQQTLCILPIAVKCALGVHEDNSDVFALLGSGLENL